MTTEFQDIQGLNFVKHITNPDFTKLIICGIWQLYFHLSHDNFHQVPSNKSKIISIQLCWQLDGDKLENHINSNYFINIKM